MESSERARQLPSWPFPMVITYGGRLETAILSPRAPRDGRQYPAVFFGALSIVMHVDGRTMLMCLLKIDIIIVYCL